MRNVFLALVLISLATHSASAAVDKVSLILNWKPEPEFGGFYAAQENGAFQSQNLNVEILPGGSGTPAIQMVAAGSTMFGVASAEEVVLSQERGTDVVAIFAVYQKSPQGIMVHNDPDLTSIEDVFKKKNLTLALQRGFPFAIHLEKKFSFLKIRVVPYTGGVTEFLQRRDFAQQCFVTSEPIAARKQGGDPKTFLVADTGFNPYFVVVTQRSLFQKNPNLVRRFHRAITQGWQDYLRNPHATNAVISKLNPTLDVATLDQMADVQKPLILGDNVMLGSMSEERWKALAKRIAELKMIKSPQPAAQYFLPLQ